MNHAENFEQYVVRSDIGYDVVTLDGGAKGFKFYQQLENGPRLLLGVIFNPNNTIVDLNIFNIAKISNPLKQELYLTLINELNNQYRYTKFTIVNDEIQANYALPLTAQADMSEVIFDLLIMLLRSVEDSFPKLMKLQWS